MTYEEAFKKLCRIADENGLSGPVSLDLEKIRTKQGSICTGVTAWVDHETFGGRSFGAVLKKVKAYAAKEPFPEVDKVVM